MDKRSGFRHDRADGAGYCQVELTRPKESRKIPMLFSGSLNAFPGSANGASRRPDEEHR
jgi:hypothetical protein